MLLADIVIAVVVAPTEAAVTTALLIIVAPIACLRYIVNVPSGCTSFATFVLANNSPIAKFAPPPVISRPYNADALLLYINVAFSSHSSVSAFHCLVFRFAPPFGAVVLIQTLPVGREYVSAILNSGTLVCAETCTAGG